MAKKPFSWICSLLLVVCLTHTGCFNTTQPSTYYGKVVPPKTQEFRWSNGGLPQTFDPAFAAAPPDTDAVRALFEGLTDYDPKTLAPVPAVATRWESSNDGRVWTFYLRDNARWSNGEKVTAQDFVRSWERTLKIGPLAPHTELLANIEGAIPAVSEPHTFGARAIDENVLQVTLQHADSSFPALVAHPVFRPVKVANAESTTRLESHELISNGAFHLLAAETNQVQLERAKTYWDDASVALDRVTFVNTTNAEGALSAYEAGEIDAVTNAPFEPLALKLLAPYKDFHRSTFGALTYYAFNTAHEPFDDVRVREALALAIDRERVSRDDLGGATVPAGRFLPEEMSGEKPVVDKAGLVERDVNKARALLDEAGYPNGEGFPVIRLLINRNEQQRIVAQSIASMWRVALNVETEIVIRNWDEYEAAIQAGDYDIVRRGMVMQSTSELVNLRMIFERDPRPLPSASPEASPSPQPVPQVETEAQALKDMKAVPIYFASSYSLVKPYVSGFDTNVLDVPSLKKTRIATNWVQP
ncbi:MAG TPA: peptide ABC transporter substrate-binding protein [Pyrinomonadaceae bacterium]|nr:peptide ABC transporter substrate-binding protein [Pyrinomonadaceae bacterium]